MSTSPPTPLLVASGLTATLPGDSGEVRVLDGASLELHAEEILDVTGPSGSGKTTLVLALARLLPGASGRLELDGVSAEKFTAQSWRADVALLPQKPSIIAGSVRDNLLLPWGLKIRAAEQPPTDVRLESELARAGLDGVAVQRDAARLSVGQQARVALCRVLLTSPKVLLLDEPDAALDEASAAAVARIVSEFARSGGGVVRVRHRAGDGLARRRLKMHSGRLSEVTA